jgi:hypothetical protein
VIDVPLSFLGIFAKTCAQDIPGTTGLA